jgi:hypothetical protein
MTSGSNCLEILFVTSEGRMGAYSEAFSAILASVRLAPAN